MPIDKQGSVFISCGQSSLDEINLGQKIASVVNSETLFGGYFAQDQASLEGLSRSVFGALKTCVGFVAVMHNRGKVTALDGEHNRGSVWVEQEIAIAAFLQQAYGRVLPVVIYTQAGIKLEGLRTHIQLNPIVFKTESDVLMDFTARLKDGRFSPVALQDIQETTRSNPQPHLEFTGLSVRRLHFGTCVDGIHDPTNETQLDESVKCITVGFTNLAIGLGSKRAAKVIARVRFYSGDWSRSLDIVTGVWLNSAGPRVAIDIGSTESLVLMVIEDTPTAIRDLRSGGWIKQYLEYQGVSWSSWVRIKLTDQVSGTVTTLTLKIWKDRTNRWCHAPASPPEHIENQPW